MDTSEKNGTEKLRYYIVILMDFPTQMWLMQRLIIILINFLLKNEALFMRKQYNKNPSSLYESVLFFALNPRLTALCFLLLLCYTAGCRGEYITTTQMTREKDGDYDNFWAGGDAGLVRAKVIGGWASYSYWKDNYRNPDVERRNSFEEQLKLIEEKLKLSCRDARISLKEKECSLPNSCDSRIICS